MIALMLLAPVGWAQDAPDEPAEEAAVAEVPPTPPERSVVEMVTPRRRTARRGVVAFELGSLASRDPSFDLFSDGNALPSRGVKLGYRIAERVELVAGWHRASRGAEVDIPDVGSELDFDGGASEFYSVFTTDQFTLGPRVDIEIANIVWPYVAAQGLVVRGMARLDEDLSVNNNVNQLRATGAGFGVMGFGGVEIRFPYETIVKLSLHAEVGYGYVSPMRLGEFGSMSIGGFAVRSGVGLRF